MNQVQNQKLKGSKYGLLLILIIALYYAMANLGFVFAYPGSNASPFWPPAGISLALMLLLGYRIWPAIFIAAILVNLEILLSLGLGWPKTISVALITAVGNTLEALMGSYLIRRYSQNQITLPRVRDAYVFIFLGAFLSTFVAALIGSLSFFLLSPKSIVFWGVFGQRWLGDGLSLLSFAPVILFWKIREFPKWKTDKISEFIFYLILTFSFVYFISTTNFPLKFMAIPIFLWSIFRFGKFETLALILLISMVSLYFSITSGIDPHTLRVNPILVFQLYYGVILITFLILGSVLSERKEALSSKEKTELAYEDLFEKAPVSLWEEDFSEVIAYLDTELKQKKLSLEELFNQYPNILLKCASLVKIVNVNKQTLELFEADHKEELFGNISKLFSENSIPVFKQSLLALYRGDEVFATQAENLSLKRKKLDLDLRWTFVSDQKEGFASKVILSMIDLTDLRKNEAALIESERRFRSIFQNSHTIMFFISPENGKIINANPAAVNFYGYSKEKFENELFIYDLNTLPKDEVIELVQSTQKEKKGFYNFQHRLANGEIRDVEVYSGLLQLNQKAVLFSIVHDVTDKRKAEKLVLESKSKLESIFRVAPAGIGVISNRVFAEINDRFCEIVGYSREELLGKESALVYPSKEEFEWVGKEKYRQIQEKGTGSVETRFKRKDGKIVNIILISTPLDSTNLDLGVTFTALDITERKKASLELKQTHDRLSDTLERMSDGFVSLNKEWIYTYVNQKAADMFGRKPEDLLGKHIWTEFPEGIGQPFYNTYYKVIETQEIITFEYYYSPWDRWFKNMVIPTNEGLAIFFQDITFRKKASLALQKSNEYIQAIFDSATDAIFIHDGETGKILDVNEPMCTMYGYTKNEVMQLEFDDLGTGKHPYSMEDAKKLMLKSFNEGPQTADWIVRHKDGHFFWTEVSIRYAKIAGEGRYIASVRNIEERKKSEKELEKYRLHLEELVKERTGQLEQSQGALLNLVDDLNKQSLKLEESNASLNAINNELETFTYSVSHDLKAPLRGIDGYSRLLLDTYLDDLSTEARQFLDNIRSSANQMNLLIEDLLAYSRMERKDIISERIHLKGFINNLVPYYKAVLEQDNIRLEIDVADDFYVQADKDSLNMVFRNLIDNAIKFSAKTSQAKIEIKASENNENWLIFVKDNGIGFEMKYRERIFKIFQRLHLAEEYEGTGIGLAMVAKAMNRMNGKVWAESELGKGACFYLEIGKA
jgi:PAS domain S-box-containing protein